MDIVLLGSGNVATHLGQALTGSGHRVLQVYSRTLARARILADALGGATATDDPQSIHPGADFYVISVTDDAIRDVAASLPAVTGVVVHTAGSVPMDALSGCAARLGVCYPVQTFSKAVPIGFSAVPIALEASDEATYARLEALAGSLSNRVFRCDSTQRLSLHVAAVFACNFVNHLYGVGGAILRQHGLDFDLLRPLILETAAKVEAHRPEDVQTGPAVRNDVKTMHRHLALLADHPDLAQLYTTLSDRIRITP